MTDYKAFEIPAIKCLPCQELVSHAAVENLDDGTTDLEFYCRKAGRAFHVYYSDSSYMRQSFIEGIVRSALSLCSRCNEWQHPLNGVTELTNICKDICQKTESENGVYWSSNHS